MKFLILVPVLLIAACGSDVDIEEKQQHTDELTFSRVIITDSVTQDKIQIYIQEDKPQIISEHLIDTCGPTRGVVQCNKRTREVDVVTASWCGFNVRRMPSEFYGPLCD